MKILIEFEKKPLLFKNPASILSCHSHEEIPDCFAAIEKCLKKGFFVAGFFSYEAGYAFEKKVSDSKRYDFPLIYLGCYENPLKCGSELQELPCSNSISNIEINSPRKNYDRDIASIRDYISRGEVYQVTYCIKLHFSFQGSPFNLYRNLLKAQPVPYPAYLETDKFKILSLSPEMFMKKTGDLLVTKPMKGTWPRNANPFSDLFSGLRLKYDLKNRAENLMITDLLRNDLGRIGSQIQVPRMFDVAKYSLLYQMTSTVTGKVETDIPLQELFRALLPSGSVTGAPKIRAMQIIREIEKEERRIYTGAIGYITPDKNLFFNIPIRTILLSGAAGELGIGGGIIWDSTAQGEWDEGMLKAKFLTESIISPNQKS